MKVKWVVVWWTICALISFVQNQLMAQTSFLEPMLILIVMMARTTPLVPALWYTAAISVCTDLIILGSQVKGLSAMIQMALVYCMAMLHKHIVPRYWDLFVLLYFALFYFLNYYGTWGLSVALGLRFDVMNGIELLYRGVIHTLIFGAILMVMLRFSKDRL